MPSAVEYLNNQFVWMLGYININIPEGKQEL